MSKKIPPFSQHSQARVLGLTGLTLLLTLVPALHPAALHVLGIGMPY
jgi:hypothetical protein